MNFIKKYIKKIIEERLERETVSLNELKIEKIEETLQKKLDLEKYNHEFSFTLRCMKGIENRLKRIEKKTGIKIEKGKKVKDKKK